MTSQERKEKFNAIISKYNVLGYASTQDNTFDGNVGGFIDVFTNDEDSYTALKSEVVNLEAILNETGEAGDDNYTLVLPVSPGIKMRGYYIFRKGVDF